MRPSIAILVATTLGAIVPGMMQARASDELSPVKQQIKINPIPSGVALLFDGLKLLSTDVSADGMEIALHFDEPLKDSIAQAITIGAKATIADASTGYDTLLLRAQSRSRFDIDDSDNGFTLLVTSEQIGEDTTRLTLVEIRRRTLVDDTQGARELLSQLRLQRPDDVELFRTEADIDLADQDSHTAAEKYRMLLRVNPADEGLQESLSAAQADFAPRIESGVESQKTNKGDRQWRGFIAGQTPIGPALELRGRIDFVDLQDNLVQFANGTTGSFQGRRTQGSLSAVYDLGGRWSSTATVYGASETIGAGAALEYQDAASSVTLTAAYHQPSWDYTESIVANGSTDFAGLRAMRSFSDEWFFNLGIAAHQFSLDDESQAATSVTFEAGLRWALPLESPTKITLGYTFDAEYVDRVATRLDGMGDQFALLPIRDRVVHSADLRIAEQLTHQLFSSFYVGYSRDLNSKGGYIVGTEMAYAPTDDLRIAFTANYSGVSDRAGDSGAYMHAGLTITRAFAMPSGETNGD